MVSIRRVYFGAYLTDCRIGKSLFSQTVIMSIMYPYTSNMGMEREEFQKIGTDVSSSL